MDTASRFSQRWSGTWSLHSKRSSTSSSKTTGTDTGSFQKILTFKRRRRSARKHIKNIFFRLFFPPPPTTDRTTTPHPSAPTSIFSLSSRDSTLVSSSISKHKSLGTKATSTTIIKPPPWKLSPSKPIPTSRKKPYTTSSSQKSTQNSIHDSKFSSVSTSLSSLHLSAHPHPNIKTLTPPQHTHLSRLLHRAARSLAYQEYLSAHFSSNLVYLFTVKERSIFHNKRLNSECKSRMLRTLSRLRDDVGKVFLRKAVFLQRDARFVRDLSGILASTPEAALAKEICGGVFEVRIDVGRFAGVAERLKGDANVQQELDQDLRRGILKAVFDGRVVGSVADRVAMRRFLMFVESRVVRMGEEGLRFRGGVEEMEALVAS